MNTVVNRENNTVDFHSFVNMCMETALWSSTDLDSGEHLDEYYLVTDFSSSAKEKITATCKEFIAENIDHLITVTSSETLPEYDSAAAGHDLWLSMNNHGCGFFDRYYGQETNLTDAFDALDRAARELPECIVVAENNQIEVVI
jgi:hypothetical protein